MWSKSKDAARATATTMQPRAAVAKTAVARRCLLPLGSTTLHWPDRAQAAPTAAPTVNHDRAQQLMSSTIMICNLPQIASVAPLGGGTHAACMDVYTDPSLWMPPSATELSPEMKLSLQASGSISPWSHDASHATVDSTQATMDKATMRQAELSEVIWLDIVSTSALAKEMSQDNVLDRKIHIFCQQKQSNKQQRLKKHSAWVQIRPISTLDMVFRIFYEVHQIDLNKRARSQHTSRDPQKG